MKSIAKLSHCTKLNHYTKLTHYSKLNHYITEEDEVDRNDRSQS